MALSANDRRPKHRQIADWIVSQIIDGALAPGDRLPSARELMDRFDVSNQTAQNAVKLLQSEGLAEGSAGTRHVPRRDPSIPAQLSRLPPRRAAPGSLLTT